MNEQTRGVFRIAGGATASVVLFALLGPIGLLLGAWLTFSPDPVASTGRSGGTGALAAGGRAAGSHLANEWRRGAPARQRRRTERRDRWWDAGGWRRRALSLEHRLILAGRALKSLFVAGREAAQAAPKGARQAVAADRERRAARRERRRTGQDPAAADPAGAVPDPTADPAADPGADPNGSANPSGSAGPGDPPPLQDSGSEPAPGGAPPGAPQETPQQTPQGTPEGTPQTQGDPMAGNTTTTGSTTTGSTAADGAEAGPGSGELQNTGDLRAETVAVQQLISEAELLAGLLRDWQTALPDRHTAGVAAGGPSTRALREAVEEVTSAGGDAVALGEATGLLRRACDQADALGEQAAAMGASGHTRGYVPD